jgi:hypothetical protein
METKLFSVCERFQRLRRGLLCGMENNEQTCRIDTYTSRIMRTPIRTREQLFFVFHIAAWGLPRISVDFNLYFTCQNTKLTKVLISVREPFGLPKHTIRMFVYTQNFCSTTFSLHNDDWKLSRNYPNRYLVSGHAEWQFRDSKTSKRRNFLLAPEQRNLPEVVTICFQP